LSEQESKTETSSPAQATGETPEDHLEGSSETASGGESPQPAVAAGVEPAAATAEKEKEEPPVRYELLEALPRAGSVVDMKFKISYEEYQRKMQQFFKDLRQTVIIDGFRRGKAPLKLIQNRYQKEVKQDTLDFLLGNCLEQITKEKGYAALREFDRVDPEVVEGQEMVFAISLEIRPKIDPTGYDHFELTVDAHEINEAVVEAEIEKLRHRHATYQTVEFSPWQPGLALTVDIQVANDKNSEIADLTRKDLFLTHPDRVLPEPVVEQLRDRRAGESVVARVPNVRRSEGGVVVSEHDVYYIKVLEVEREILPEVNDQFARDIGGFQTAQELRDHMRKELETREEKRVREEALEKIYASLFERNPFDVPQTLLTETSRNLALERLQRLREMGLSLVDLGEDVDSYTAHTRARAERMIRVVLLKEAIADKEKIAPTDEDVERAIALKAAEEGRRPLAVRARLEAQKAMDRFREDLRYDLVDDFLLAHANISKQLVSPECRIVTPGNA